jgi:hypothetical protein
VIKLSSLIKEIISNKPPEGSGMGVWKTPEGVPDEVIDVMHRITAVLVSDKKDIQKYVGLRKENIPPIGYSWIIENKKHRDLSLAFNERRRKWYEISYSRTMVKQLDARSLNLVIAIWAA